MVRLHATPEHTREIAERVSSRQNWAYVIGGSAVALLGTGVALYANNNSRYQSWQQSRAGLSRDIQSQSSVPDLDRRVASVRETAVSIQRRDDLALGTSVLGGALLSYAVISWLTAK